MRRVFWQLIFSVFFLSIGTVASFADQKIKQRTTMQGQTFETTVMTKGSRQRTESTMGGEAGKFMPKVATVMQCDLRRTLQINDAQKLYIIQPFAEEVPDNAPVSNNKSSVGKTERGGVVTITYTVTDTGERKQFFGLTARRVKTMMMTEPSPDACQKDKTRMETDGWYIDLAGFNCPMNRPQTPPAPQSGNTGCQDRMQYKTNSAAAKLGFPLNVTTTVFDKNGNPAMTMTTETLELSTATLDAALFDIPKGYTQASSAQELYKFDPTEMMRQNSGGDSDDNDNNLPATRPNTNSVNNSVKKAGAVRIGVLALSNKSGQPVSVENLREGLINSLSSGNVEAVAVNSVEDARSRSCDFVLYTDITKLKQSAANKIGGMFGKVTGTEAIKDKFELQIDYKLNPVAGNQTTIENKVTQKSEGDAETVVQAALNQVARVILNATKAKN
jgi:hypothetical protein